MGRGSRAPSHGGPGRLDAAGREGRTYTFDHYRPDGRAAVRIHTGVGRDTRTALFQDRHPYVWDKRSDTATLRNDRGRFIGDYSWGRHRGNRR
ncbi:hypothetical protein [Streptomyces viridosporus]|uniref:hypothetical protein n=1 Tax=Streptomyces viridosporus TaxID=67581 RepID=UPI0001AF1CE0